jgi:hypothetical protein
MLAVVVADGFMGLQLDESLRSLVPGYNAAGSMGAP